MILRLSRQALLTSHSISCTLHSNDSNYRKNPYYSGQNSALDINYSVKIKEGICALKSILSSFFCPAKACFTRKKQKTRVQSEGRESFNSLYWYARHFLGLLGSHFDTVWTPPLSSLSCLFYIPFPCLYLGFLYPCCIPLFLTLFFFCCPTSFFSFHSP